VPHSTKLPSASGPWPATQALEAGRLVNRVGPTFPLADIAAAHEAVERGTIGNVIVKVS
jgi:NADPH:quinone reductase